MREKTSAGDLRLTRTDLGQVGEIGGRFETKMEGPVFESRPSMSYLLILSCSSFSRLSNSPLVNFIALTFQIPSEFLSAIWAMILVWFLAGSLLLVFQPLFPLAQPANTQLNLLLGLHMIRCDLW